MLHTPIESTGSTIGSTVAYVVFWNILTSQLWQRLGHENDAPDTVARVRKGLSAIKVLPFVSVEAAMQAYTDALRGVLLIL